VLGRGAHSTSYLAQSSARSGSLVVLRVFDAAFGGRVDAVLGNSGERLLTFRAPGVARTRQLGTTPSPYLVRDFVVGIPLASFIQRTPCSRATGARIVRDLREAVAEIHAARLQHRRLTASNVIVTGTASEPRAVIVDLGVEALRADDAEPVEPGRRELSRLEADVDQDEAAVSRLAELIGLNRAELDAL
jgi:serine/threonine protein kinase